MEHYYLPVAGTNGWRDGWVVDDTHPHPRMMRSEGFEPIRLRGGRPVRWASFLDGLIGDDEIWEAGSDVVTLVLERLPFEHRNVIGHSHGGNIVLKAAARGLQLRSLTTVGTPVRSDCMPELAATNIQSWQHIYDRRCDLMGTLGKLGGGSGVTQRAFLIPGVQNHPLDGIGHSKILRDAKFMHYWTTNNWLQFIREAPPMRSPVGGHV
jgi:pimeloyl-ACP methyl ester carboxylesterase